MLVSKIMTAALAHTYEEPDIDNILTRNLTVPLINLGIAELTAAENAYRVNKGVEELTEPVTVEKPEDDVQYDYHITTILLPLWLAWKIFEGLDDTQRAESYRILFEQRKADLVPVVWNEMQDFNNGCTGWCCHET